MARSQIMGYQTPQFDLILSPLLFQDKAIAGLLSMTQALVCRTISQVSSVLPCNWLITPLLVPILLLYDVFQVLICMQPFCAGVQALLSRLLILLSKLSLLCKSFPIKS